jgi:hypothetical protein
MNKNKQVKLFTNLKSCEKGRLSIVSFTPRLVVSFCHRRESILTYLKINFKTKIMRGNHIITEITP